MKTAVSVPNEVFRPAESAARRLGLSRSALYTDALREYLQRHRADRVREKLDQVYGREESRLDPALGKLQSRSLPKGKW